MTDLVSWLRAQIPSSTDPDRLERLAREAERQAVLRRGIATVVRQRSPSKPPAQGVLSRPRMDCPLSGAADVATNNGGV